MLRTASVPHRFTTGCWGWGEAEGRGSTAGLDTASVYVHLTDLVVYLGQQETQNERSVTKRAQRRTTILLLQPWRQLVPDISLEPVKAQRLYHFLTVTDSSVLAAEPTRQVASRE